METLWKIWSLSFEWKRNKNKTMIASKKCTYEGYHLTEVQNSRDNKIRHCWLYTQQEEIKDRVMAWRHRVSIFTDEQWKGSRCRKEAGYYTSVERKWSAPWSRPAKDMKLELGPGGLHLTVSNPPCSHSDDLLWERNPLPGSLLYLWDLPSRGPLVLPSEENKLGWFHPDEKPRFFRFRSTAWVHQRRESEKSQLRESEDPQTCCQLQQQLRTLCLRSKGFKKLIAEWNLNQ